MSSMFMLPKTWCYFNGRAFEFVIIWSYRPITKPCPFHSWAQHKHNMTLQQFNRMNGTDQLMALVANGVFLAEQQTKHLCYRLYQISCFYIEEISPMNGTESMVLQLHPFNGTEKLDRYLTQINLEGLRF